MKVIIFPTQRRHLASALLISTLSGAVFGCGSSSDRGTVTVLMQAEDTITEGLSPGTGRERIVDGWEVRFDKYLLAIGNVKLGRDATHIEVTDSTKVVYDLVQIPQGDWIFAELTDLEAKRYDFFGYETVAASQAQRHSSVSAADYEAMVDRDATYLIEGTLIKADEQVTFRFVVPNETAYGPCSANGVPGLAVTGNGAVAVGLTIHGDHLFFDSFDSHDVQRRAQWIADADLDEDGHVDEEELKAIQGPALSELLPSELYALGGWSAFPIESAYDFLRAQLHTQGHYQGEGECVRTVSGVSSGHDDHDDHDHDDHDH